MVKLIIIGKGNSWTKAPFETGTPVWGITQLILKRPCDLVIDMNIYEDGRWGDVELQEAREVKEICETNRIPYICLDNYPFEEVTKRFETDYFSSTVDYALALAIYNGFQEIDLYGITMGSDSDYYKMKSGCDFWCGYAKGLGVKVRVHGKTTCMKTEDGKVYGYNIEQRPLF